MMGVYNDYSDHLKSVYGEKVYKIPVSIPVTCPNRDGLLSNLGCTFCGDLGAGYQHVPDSISIEEQIENHKVHIIQKYNAHKFIAYFPNYSTTYLPLIDLKKYLEEACVKDVVRLALGTRPDCLNENYVRSLRELSQAKGIEISVELGLQIANYHVLHKINRQHTLAEYLMAMQLLNKYGLISCTHVILNLPNTDLIDTIETAKIISVMGSKEAKLHALYIVKGTSMAADYLSGKLVPGSEEEYIERAATFLEYLDPDIAIQRLIGRAPKSHTEFSNWSGKWWEIRELIKERLKQRESYQGHKCDYMRGKALEKFNAGFK